MPAEEFVNRADDASAYLEVSTATETRASAVALAQRAVETRLAAGAQITGPAVSAFWHMGEFGTGEEWRLVLRTHESRFAELRDLLKRHHPWQNPEIIAMRMAGGSAEYLAWIRSTVLSENG
ncbi:divalent-cation tolerance protein CutA [Actinoplanes sp. NPDC023936]|uniref:divalent-cation tolerance protein CutA n=1 Tax=Actinoplanes sp. NPDC023936 TaxID=3154910 RepID=UPI0034058A96